MSTGPDINLPRRLIIHCGVQRTDTTSLHKFLQRNHNHLSPHLEILTPRKGTPAQRPGRAGPQFSQVTQLLRHAILNQNMAAPPGMSRPLTRIGLIGGGEY